MERRNKREKQRLSRKKQILECALDMIIARGFDAMKIRDIADKLNISTGLFFNYFESKEKVYEELVNIGLSGPAHALALDTEGIEPIMLFERITEYIFSALTQDDMTGKMFLLMTQAMRSEAAPEGVKSLLASFDAITPLVKTVIHGQTLHQIKQGDPAALLIAYWGAVQGVAEYHTLYPSLPLPQISWIVDIIRVN